MKYRISLHSWSSLLAILLAMEMSSCAAPTTPASNPTLTLILPDSARAFDTVTLRAHYSDPVRSSWKFAWQFGDSATASSKDTTITHVYDSAGTYTVMVSLVDTNGTTIAKQEATIHIYVLHFDPALLSSFSSVAVESYGMVDSSWSGQNYGVENSGTVRILKSFEMDFRNVTWSGSTFGSHYSYYQSDTGYGISHISANGDSILGSVDHSFTAISSLFASVWDGDRTYDQVQGVGEVETGGQGSSSSATLSNIHFKSSSDSEIVFEANPPFAWSEYFEQDSDAMWLPRSGGWVGTSSLIDLKDSSVVPQIIIRFHK